MRTLQRRCMTKLNGFLCCERPAKSTLDVHKSFKKMWSGTETHSLHSAEEECESFLTALCTRMTCTNHDEKCNKFHPNTWKIHVRILRPIVVREKRAPAHNN
jgi:hypothetical protein